MSDVKSVIALLCKHLSLSIGCTIKPESFRLAKYDKDDEEVIHDFWTILHDLSDCAIKEENVGIDFDRYDDLHATKLNFAFLQYPTANFYALSKISTHGSQELLLALGWLIASKNIMNIVMKKKLRSSVLGHEYSCNDDAPANTSIVETKEMIYESSVDSKSRMRKIVHTCGRVSHNVKEITELLSEKIKLTTKIHAATLNASGLPHLSVFQVAMTKKSCTNSGKDFTTKHEDSLEELKSLGLLLEIHDQWTRKGQHVFYDWMVTVIEETRINRETTTIDNRTDELTNFLSLLRHVTKKKLHSSKFRETKETEETRLYDDACVSRFHRTHEMGSEAEIWCSQTSERLNIVEEKIKINMSQFTLEMKKMLKSIPNCVEI